MKDLFRFFLEGGANSENGIGIGIGIVMFLVRGLQEGIKDYLIYGSVCMYRKS